MRCMSCKFNTNIELLNLIQHWVICSWEHDAKVLFRLNEISFIIVTEKQTVIWFTIVHASRDQEGSLVYLPDGRVDRIFRHYAGIIPFFFASLHIGHQPSAWLTSDIVNGFKTLSLLSSLSLSPRVSRSLPYDDESDLPRRSHY